MTYSLQYLRQFAREFQDQADRTRIFFPDIQELKVAKYGKSKDPNAGSWDIGERMLFIFFSSHN
jgi:hypothetical protein